MNANIINMLERMLWLRTRQGETGKIHGYTRAIRSIKEYPQQITSAQQASHIPGVGPSIAQRIGEFLTTGHVSELAPDDEKDRIVKLFMSVGWIGIEKAENLYNAGYRRLEDIPESVLTRAQWISLQLRNDLSQKIPREEIDLFQRSLTEFLSPMGITFQICGSYRRGRPVSSDIDILVIDKPGVHVMNEILKWPLIAYVIASGEKKSALIGRIAIHRRIDIQLVQPHEYPFAVTYFTGPDSFNIKMRTYCASFGLRLNEKELIDAQGISRVVQSEQHLFEVLGLAWLTPEQRDAY